jgi:hypothetical protein
MRQSFRPYTMVVNTSTTGTKETVSFKDTAGNDFYANYISIAVSGEGQPAGDGMYRCSIAVPGTTTPEANYDSAADMIDGTTSGVPGVYFSTSFPGELLLSDNDRVNQINIEAFRSGGNATYLITYGQVSVGNNMRDQDRPVGS